MNYINVGYAIRRTMKGSVLATQGDGYARVHPEYILPGEGYWRIRPDRSNTSPGLRLGWGSLEEVEKVLADAELEAADQGDINFWNQYNYEIVKVTVNEEEV